MTRTELETELTDLFDNAITDSIDIDWLTIDGARACVKALREELLDEALHIQRQEKN